MFRTSHMVARGGVLALVTPFAILAGGMGQGVAQVTMPGLVVTTPPQAGAPAPAAAPSQQSKRQTKPAKPAKAAAADDRKVPAQSGSGGKAGQSIILIVNDEPVTQYEVLQRARLLSLNGIGEKAQENFKRLAQSEETNRRFRAIIEEIVRANQGKSREHIMGLIEARKKVFAQSLQQQALESARGAAVTRVTKEAQEEIIEEKLKLQEARRLGVEVSDDEVSRIIKGLAGKNNVSEAQFAQNLARMGVDISTMKARYKANLSWRDVIRRRFSAQISVQQRDIDRLLASNPAADGDGGQELHIQKITYPLPARVDQLAMAKALAEADGARRKFTSCKSMPQIAAATPGASFEDLKFVKTSSLPEPARSLVLNAKDGELLPPQTGSKGVELFAVCERRQVKSDDKRRDEAAQELQSQQFEQLAKKHLRDLRQDAHIEMR